MQIAALCRNREPPVVLRRILIAQELIGLLMRGDLAEPHLLMKRS